MNAERTELTELVLDVVDQIPPGQVCTYGLVAEAVRSRSGHGSARHVGTIMAAYGAEVPWWRVVRADGTLPRPLRAQAREHYLQEGTALNPLAPGMVDLRRALWDAPTHWSAPDMAAVAEDPDA